MGHEVLLPPRGVPWGHLTLSKVMRNEVLQNRSSNTQKEKKQHGNHEELVYFLRTTLFEHFFNFKPCTCIFQNCPTEMIIVQRIIQSQLAILIS